MLAASGRVDGFAQAAGQKGRAFAALAVDMHSGAHDVSPSPEATARVAQITDAGAVVKVDSTDASDVTIVFISLRRLGRVNR